MVTPRLRALIGELYHPGAKRRLFALSRAEAESLPCLPTLAIISVTAPERPLAELPAIEYVLRVQFADVDWLSPDLSARASAKLADRFTPIQATQILRFVEGLPPEILSIVVHCEGGYSRSCAIALALHQRYGYLVEIDRLTAANQSVLRTLIQAVKPQGR